MVNYHENPVLKHVLYTGFVGTMALSMVPLINMASMPIIFDALFATGISMAGFAAIAYNAPSEEFLKWGGAMGIGLGAMIGLGIMNMFWQSKALWNIYLYGGLVFFSALTLYDV